MSLPKVTWKNCGLSQLQAHTYTNKLLPELERMQSAGREVYADVRASINLPLDNEHIAACKKLARKHKAAKLLVVVGIGGSNLGTWAVQDAVLGKLHNQLPGTRPTVLYMDTVDPRQTSTVLDIVRKTLRARKHVVINVISKSGETTETVANAQILIEMLKQMKKDPKKHVVCTTGKHSKLWHFAKDHGYELLPIPKNVGGRYSVFSPVGLFPLALLKVDIETLLDGAADMRARCLKEKQNPAMLRAAMLAHALENKRNIADNMYFSTDLESMGKWYRQLMGESIGKEWDSTHKKRLWMGMTPTVSLGTTDLHSMAQLYFGGPQDKFHTLLSVQEWQKNPKLPRKEEYSTLVQNIQGKSLLTIMDAVLSSVETVFRKQSRPFCTITLPNLKEYSIGALMQLHMIEIMFLGAYFGINPFDQPNVEEYKKETRRILARSS